MNCVYIIFLSFFQPPNFLLLSLLLLLLPLYIYIWTFKVASPTTRRRISSSPRNCYSNLAFIRKRQTASPPTHYEAIFSGCDSSENSIITRPYLEFEAQYVGNVAEEKKKKNTKPLHFIHPTSGRILKTSKAIINNCRTMLFY